MKTWVLLGFAATLACGGATTDAQDGGFDAHADAKKGDGSLSFYNDAGDADVFVITAPCPTQPPAQGAACTQLGELCEYGDNLYPSCDSVYRCDEFAQTWSLEPQSNLVSCYPSSNGCPSTMPPVQGSCSTSGAACQYAGAYCACEYCGGPPDPGNMPTTWSCLGDSPSCPYPRPRLGTPCTQEGAQCDYTICCTGAWMECSNGVWLGQTENGPCP